MFKTITTLGAGMLLSAVALQTQAQTWQYVGSSSSTGISAGIASYQSLKISPSGVPYVAYRDNANGDKTTVISFNGTNWGNVGSAGISAGQSSYQSLAFSPSGVPYVAYKGDFSNDFKTTVLSFNGSNWGAVGNVGISAGSADFQSLAFSPSGIPYVAYQDGVYSFKTTVLSFNGMNWGVVGNAGISAGSAGFQSIAFSPSGIPYVAYQDDANGSKTTVLSFNGTNWGVVGSVGFSTSTDDNQSLAFSPSGVPYVTYKDVANGNKTTVLSFDGTNWGAVGGIAGISAGQAVYQSLAFSPSGVPYVAFNDNANNGKTTVLSFNGSNWGAVGNVGISAGSANYQSLAFSPSGVPYVAYQDGANNSKTNVLKFDKASQQINNLAASQSLVYGSSSLSLANVTATSGLTVSFSSSNNAVASISGSNVVIIGAGIVTITGSQVGDNNYFAAANVLGVITVTKANLTVSADNYSRQYGLANPTFTGSITGAVNGDVITPSFNTTGLQTSNAGTYTISVIGINNGNYALIAINGTLTVTKAPLTITGPNITRTYGTAINVSLLTPSISGTIFFGDGITINTSTNFNTNADAGTYPVNVEPVGAKVVNYNITTIAGVQTIEKANQNIINFGPFDDITINGINTPSPTLTATASSGLTVVFSISGAAFISNGAISVTGTGEITVTATQGGNNNFLPALTLTQTFNVRTIPGLGTPITDSSVETKLALVVYPNPVVNGEWRIENAEVGATVYLFNAQGSVVYTQTITSASTEVSAKLSSGIYLVKVGKQMVKLVVE